MAKKNERNNPPQSSSAEDEARLSGQTHPRIFAVQQAILLTILPSVFLPICQLCLSPVYGSVQANLYQRWIIVVLVPLSLLSHLVFSKSLPSKQIIGALAFAIPNIQFLLFKFSGRLGVAGTIVTELLTYYPLAFVSLYAAAVHLKVLQDEFSELLVSGLLYALFIFVQNFTRLYLPRMVGTSIFFTRVGLQLSVAAIYTLAIPSTLAWTALPSIAFTLLANPHTPLPYTTSLLNTTLQSHNFSLLSRHESITGYISVLENNQAQFRVMRCDHSLLGGEWTMAPPSGHHPRVAEPIYTIFTMLEAVRLIEVSHPMKPSLSALNIGLGIGTAPNALIAHGINTTILELDAVVYTYAKDFFDLSPNHTAHITDAVQWVLTQSFLSPSTRPTYDFIIHDVFTGGSEPIPLFTHEFLTSLSTLLAPSGAIAINYAGDLQTLSPALVYHTIASVFPTCRIFRESLAPKSLSKTDPDFTNMVIFCTKTPQKPLTFRPAVPADFLGSGARQEWLEPRVAHEIDPRRAFGEADEKMLLKRGSEGIKTLEKLQAKSAIGHWKVMRGVLPDVVWENW